MDEDFNSILIQLPWGDWVDPRCVVGVQFFGEDVVTVSEDDSEETLETGEGWQISVIVVASGNGFQFNSPLFREVAEVRAVLEKTMRCIGRIPDN